MLSVFTSAVYAESNRAYLQSFATKKAQIAIIIDDIGNKPADADAFVLPEKVTFAILPHTEYSTGFSRWASQQGREVMLHMPMESLNGKALGKGAILSTMYPNEVEKALVDALNSVPDAVGVNNHMGSKLTQITLQMSSVMDVLRDRGLFFVDSRTTKFTRAHLIAQKTGVLSAQRHIFLDHYARESFLKRQLDTLIRQARKKGKAIGIAHPYPVSIAFLNTALVNLPADIDLISVSEYFGHQKFRPADLQHAEKQNIDPLMVSPE
jgi:polysaccharide deacetylase 2 family uncharacterized protein YibQ